MVAAALEKELETFHRRFNELESEEGRYVLISGDDILEVFDTYEAALTAGYTRVGFNPFLVKQVQSPETRYHFTRRGVGERASS